MESSLYERDFYAWTNEQAALLRSGRFSAADMENIAEEIESMGRSEKRELVNRLTVLLLHLLKWKYQPARRGNSWRATIRVQRNELANHLDDNPSLRVLLADAMTKAYRDAVVRAGVEIRVSEKIFPATCPWSGGEVMSVDFLPE